MGSRLPIIDVVIAIANSPERIELTIAGHIVSPLSRRKRLLTDESCRKCLLDLVILLPRKQYVRSIVVSMSVCLFVCLSVCSHNSKTAQPNFNFCACCLWSWLEYGRPLTALRYVYVLDQPTCLQCMVEFITMQHQGRSPLSTIDLLYPPSERSERGYTVMLAVLLSFRAHSVFRCKYLENGFS